MPTLNTQELVERLISLIEDDRTLDEAVRRRAGGLRDLAARNPDAALEGLDELAADVVPGLAVGVASEDLAKCVGIEKFWQHYLRLDVKAFVSPTTYRLDVERSAEPGVRLLADVCDDPILLRAKNSWLVRLADLVGVAGSELGRLLTIRSTPPYSIFLFPLHLLIAHHVQVRQPRAVDAIPHRLDEWRPGGLPSGVPEFIDQDVPHAALGSIEWRP